jgi:4,5-dihydroxyphthalate decarboxylase
VTALADGRAEIEGCDTTFEPDVIGNLNTHVFTGPGTREVTEIGLHPVMLAFLKGDFRDYALLPVFPLRLFRHKSVFIRTDRGIDKPEDLRGRKIGTPGYSSTSLTWIRGILEDEYGLKPTEVEWVIASRNSAAKDTGQVSQHERAIPEGLSVSQGPEGLDESDLLAQGHVDALFHAAQPRAFVEGHPQVARLFPDSRAVERDYYARTGIFPIMHAVAIRRDAVREHPWLPRAVFDGYSRAKQMGYADMAQRRWFSDMLPWYGQELEETRALMGDDFYSYGIGPNRKTLETLFRYSHQQGLSSRELKVEELFEPTSLGFSEVS